MTVNDDREIFVRTTIRELVIYIMFIGVLSIGQFRRMVGAFVVRDEDDCYYDYDDDDNDNDDDDIDDDDDDMMMMMMIIDYHDGFSNLRDDQLDPLLLHKSHEGSFQQTERGNF